MKPLIEYSFEKEGAVFNESILSKVARKRALRKARWIDATVALAIPGWKTAILRRYPYRFMQKLLMVNIKIEHRHMLFDFGTEITIFMNGKFIASRKFRE